MSRQPDHYSDRLLQAGCTIGLALAVTSAALFVPNVAFAAFNKGKATLANTAILSLILLPMLVLLLVFTLHKFRLNRKNMEQLRSLSALNAIYEPNLIRSRVCACIDVILSGMPGGNGEMLREYVTPEMVARYGQDRALFDRYKDISFDMIMAVDAAGCGRSSIVVAVNAARISARGEVRRSHPESWHFVHDGARWLLADITDNSIVDYY